MLISDEGLVVTERLLVLMQGVWQRVVGCLKEGIESHGVGLIFGLRGGGGEVGCEGGVGRWLSEKGGRLGIKGFRGVGDGCVLPFFLFDPMRWDFFFFFCWECEMELRSDLNGVRAERQGAVGCHQ